MTSNERKVCFLTMGCQMQVSDEAKLKGMFQVLGFSTTHRLEEASVAILNGCVVRDTAEAKALSKLALLKQWKKKKQARILGVVGCFASLYKQKDSLVDFLVTPQEYETLPATLSRLFHQSELQPLLEQSLPLERSPITAFLPAMRGCNYACTFCIVPSVRGREQSLSISALLDQARQLTDNGYREIILLGQNILSYGKDFNLAEKRAEGFDQHHPFSYLLRKLSEIEGISRIRFVTSHPRDVCPELLETMQQNRKIMPYLHLPVQSGDNDILKRMGRGYTRERYLALLQTIRAYLPDIALSTDIIVGFPGETRAQFGQTLRLFEQADFDQAFTFRYSPRQGTPAASWTQVSEAEKRDRLAQLNQLAETHIAQKHQKYLHTIQQVLLEQKEDNTYIGKSPTNCTVKARGKGKVGKIVKVRINAVRTRQLEGEIVN